MFQGNGRRPQHSLPPHVSEANVNQVIPLGWPGRQMGPPQLNCPPQPVEIDPVSYPRPSGSYALWESTSYSTGPLGEPNPPVSNSIAHNKSGPGSLDFGTRNSPQDPITNWYTGNDGPWIPKGAVPEVSQDERINSRGYALYRNPGYGSSPGIRHRPGNPSDNGSVPFGISPSDSGYGTGISLESASVRGSDIVDHSQNNRSLLGRASEIHRYNESGPARQSHGPEQWPYNSPSMPLYRCPTCLKGVKTKSELKKHHLRHTKPFRCQSTGCNRIEGFSTVNDLNRHKQSKHPGDLSGEIHSKTYHCLVDGCKSQDKIWPRLDNFRSHLKRMHRLPDDAMDQFVHRGEMDQRTKGSLPSQGTSSESPSRLDQDGPLGLGSDDFPELSYPGDQQWSHVSPSSLERQTEITDQLLENADAQTLAPTNGDNPIGLGDNSGKPFGLGGSRASWGPDAGNGCLENGKTLTSSDESMTVPIKNSLGSPGGTLESTDIVERGKTSKSKKAPSIDPCLRDAIITAVFSTANPGKDNGSNSEFKSLPSVGSPGASNVPETSLCCMDSGIALPSPAALSRRPPNDQDPCLDSSSASASDKKDLTDQDATIQRILQVIKDAGYVLKKENKSQAGIGQNLNNLGSGFNKKRDPVSCSISTCKFRGRPCELKKHMKRHSRPYGCTFSKCPKTFGSKNDWRRHETSQHYQHETWRCDEKTNGTSCTKVFFSADIARAHLTKMHKVTDPEVIQRKIDARRIGANNQVHFWCGFCERIVNLTQKGVDAWTERFNHIDEHFMGKNGRTKQSIAQWKAADGEAEGVQQNVSSQPRSPNGSDHGTSDDSSPSSSDTSSSSPDISMMPPSPDTAPTQQKRKRANSDERGGRSKQPRHGKYEHRIVCCQCGFELNARIDTACPSDGHDVCDKCERKQVIVHRDNDK